jgi:hypothetical protein
MKHRLLLSALLVLGFAAAAPLPAQAQQSRLKACAEEWRGLKAANQTAGKTYRAFSKECLSRASAAAPGAATDEKPKAGGKRKAAKDDAATAQPGAPAKSGRQAADERRRACGAEWKAEKEAGKVATRMTWPKFYSACNKRKKAEGA